MKRALIAALLLVCALATGQNRARVVYYAGENGYFSYRIPVLAEARSGALLAFVEARKNSRSDAGDIDMVVKRSLDGGATWGPAITVWDDGGNTCGNPAPVVLPSGRILLLATWNDGRDKEHMIVKGESLDTRRVFCLYSDDEGLSWSEPREITAGAKRPEWTWYATGPCHAIVKQKAPNKGRIVVPCDFKSPEGIFSHLVYSDDEGRTWHIGAISEEGNNESTVAELSNGALLLNMRGSRNPDMTDQYRALAVSRDGGLTFKPQRKEKALQEPVCEGSMLNYTKNGVLTRTLLFSNPDCMTERKDMTIKQSDDNGKTWRVALKLSDRPAAYSDMAVLRDGGVGILYETGDKNPYSRIVFNVISESVFRDE